MIRQIVGFTGFTGTGKSEVAKYFEYDRGFSIIRLGEYIRNSIAHNNVSELKEIEQISNKYQEISVGEFFVQEIENYFEKNNIIIVDSLRTLADYNFFKNISEKFTLIMFLADKNNRRKWVLNRSRKGDGKNEEELQEHERWEMDFGLKELMVLSDYYVINDKNIEELKQNVTAILTKEGVI